MIVCLWQRCTGGCIDGSAMRRGRGRMRGEQGRAETEAEAEAALDERLAGRRAWVEDWRHQALRRRLVASTDDAQTRCRDKGTNTDARLYTINGPSQKKVRGSQSNRPRKMKIRIKIKSMQTSGIKGLCSVKQLSPAQDTHFPPSPHPSTHSLLSPLQHSPSPLPSAIFFFFFASSSSSRLKPRPASDERMGAIAQASLFLGASAKSSFS